MNNKTKSIISDIAADILIAPVRAAVKCVEYADKVKNIETKNGTVGSDIAQAVSKAKEAGSATTQRVFELAKDTGAATKQKVIDKAKELSESESGQKIISAAKDAYDKAGEKVDEYKGKFIDYFDGIKSKISKDDAENLSDEEAAGSEGEEDVKEDLNRVFEEIVEE